MSNSLTDQLFAQLQSGGALQQISSQLGASPTQTTSAISAALPLLMGALGKNAAQPTGAEALFGALNRDHAGGGGLDLGGLLGSVLGGGAPASAQTNGAGILGHILGSQQKRAESGISQASGLSGNDTSKLLMMLAPIVMSFLAKQMTSKNMDAQGLGQLLGQERQQVQQQGGIGGGLLGAVLDQDGDGKFDLSDMLKLGAGFLGGGRR